MGGRREIARRERGGGGVRVGDRGKPGNFVDCFVAQLGHEVIVAQES